MPKRIREVEEDNGVNDVAVYDAVSEDSEKLTKSAYEIQREENIRQNRALMAEIGLLGAGSSLRLEFGTPQSKSPKVKKSKTTSNTPELPTRSYPLRNRGSPEKNDDSSEKKKTPSKSKQKDDEPSEPEQFIDSNVFQYQCSLSTTTNEKEQDKYSKVNGKLNGYREDTNKVFSDDALKRIYSIDFSSNNQLMICGGENGWVSIYGLGMLSKKKIDEKQNYKDEEEETTTTIEALQSFRPHKKWISSCQFISSNSKLLLTTSNDSTVCIWDSSKQGDQSSMPQMLHQSSFHSSGIFSAHEKSNFILTGSKDSSVILSQLGNSGIDLIRSYDNLTDEVVKCVRWQSIENSPTTTTTTTTTTINNNNNNNGHSTTNSTTNSTPNIFACTGNEKVVKIVDKRLSGNGVVSTMTDLHSYAMNSVRWHPTDSNYLATAAFDNKIQILDMRKPSKPIVHSLVGWCGPKVVRHSSISHPLFVQNGDTLVANGEGSDSLCLFDTKTGIMISKGRLGFQASAMAEFVGVGDVNILSKSRPIALAHGRVVTLYDPIFEEISSNNNSKTTTTTTSKTDTK